MSDIENLIDTRVQLIADMRKLLESGEGENGDLDALQTEAYEKMESELDNQTQRITREERLATVPAPVIADAPVQASVEETRSEPKRRGASVEYVESFSRYMRVGATGISDSRHFNALQEGTDSEGGYIVPQEFETRLTETLAEFNVMRSLATVITTGSDRNIPIESTVGTASWVAEEASYGESDPAFDRVTLGAYKLGRIVKVSEELLQDAFFDVGTYLAQNMGRVFGTAEETAFVDGSGSGQPTGVTTASSAGVTAASATAITTDELIDLFHSLNRPYRVNATWLMKDSTVSMIRQLKDTTNQYLWQPGLALGEPDRILGRPVAVSDAMPAAATGTYAVLFGDMSFYYIADRGTTTLQRLVELYAATGQVGFRGTRRTDGKGTLSEAIKRITMA